VESLEVRALANAMEYGQLLVTTGLILQELLQGFSGPRARKAILERFNALPFLAPERIDHIEAAILRNQCRRGGIQVGTTDALLATLCIRHELTILTTDAVFSRIAEVAPLKTWKAASG
jgi:predicted nucleic acid-binding protein